jgi:hypothetical protein
VRRPSAGSALALACAGLASACQTYPQRTAAALASFDRGAFDEAWSAFSDEETTKSEFLRHAEAGMVALAAGEWDRAQEDLQAAALEVREIEEQALIGPENLGQELLALTLNEGFLPYAGEGFERVQLHAALAITYLAQGDLDGVWVEARRANQLLESEEQLYEKSYAAGGLGHFVSALAYELLEQYDQAYIDYQRMVQKEVGVELAGKALVRLGTRLDYRDETARWVERFGPDPERPEGAASIVVLAGVGLGPFKREITLPVPTGDGLLQWSVPDFERRPQAIEKLVLRSIDLGSVETSVIEHVAAVSEQNLSDRIAWLAARSAVRAIMKREVTQHLEQKYDLAGLVAGDLFTLVTERADLRAWQTLPDTWQAARLWVAPGQHQLALEAVGGQAQVLGTYELEAGETMIVLGRALGTQVYVHPIGGLLVSSPIDPEPPPSIPAP